MDSWLAHREHQRYLEGLAAENLKGIRERSGQLTPQMEKTSTLQDEEGKEVGSALSPVQRWM
jgi:hypothetical protein